jgi:ribosome biogenesis protein BRX1
LFSIILCFKDKWINRQRVLVLCGRGINFRDRHLMKDIKTIMPHHRAESKLERWKTLSVINELGEMKHCNKAMYFEGRHKQDLFMWLSSMPNGPSAKFYMENIATMSELKLTGNCLRGARPLLSFDQEFSKIPHLMLLRELLTQIFGVPNHHPKSQPFVDRIYTFTFLDNRIWFRNYQILAEDGALAEIGPRFVMNPVKIFADSFTGEALWENPEYVTPAKHRRMLRASAKDKYVNRTDSKVRYDTTLPTEAFNLDKVGKQVFVDDEEEMAEKLVAAENDDDDITESEDEEVEKKREQTDIERVKALIEKLKPGKEGKTLVRPKKYVPTGANPGKIVKKATNKKSKMIQNIIKTKKLSTKVKKPKKA